MLAHGKFTPWNTFFVGDKLYVFDREYAEPRGSTRVSGRACSSDISAGLSLESMKENVRLNHLSNVRVVGAAVVGESGKESVTLHRPIQETDKQATGAYVDKAEGIDRPSPESFVVPARFAGSIASFDPSTLDVEGAEFAILSALRDAILRCRPALMVEVRCNTPRLRRLIVDLMDGAGYEAWAMSPPRLSYVDAGRIMSVVLQDEFDTRDPLLIPKDKVGLIRGFA